MSWSRGWQVNPQTTTAAEATEGLCQLSSKQTALMINVTSEHYKTELLRAKPWQPWTCPGSVSLGFAGLPLGHDNFWTNRPHRRGAELCPRTLTPEKPAWTAMLWPLQTAVPVAAPGTLLLSTAPDSLACNLIWLALPLLAWICRGNRVE